MTYGKRGQALEKMIELSNDMYKRKGLALINKVPTPWNVHYNKKTGRVYRAFPEQKSTVDFIGVSHGRSIAFDAKSTKVRTRFPLDNVKQHQVDFLVKHREQGGISFFIIWFEKQNEFYFLPIDKFLEWWEDSLKGGRKSIPYSWFMLNCDLIVPKNGIVLDYLSHCNIERRKAN